LRASGSSILPKHPLKALWNSLSNSVQNTSLGPSIYRLTRNLKLLRFRRKLATSGRFPAISFQKQRNSIFIRFTSGRLDQVFGRSLLKSFPHSNETLEYSKILDIAGGVVTSSGRLAETSQTMSTSEIQLLVEY